ncbi:MAG: competence/damage-inducible protein A [Bacteroidetes bacterium]|nr:competence/damage-inducible protein A [Bacteroidota bacterium]
MKAAILTIGNELLNGDIANTNASWLGQQFTSLGVTVTSMITIGDSLSDIKKTFASISEEVDCVVVTGGLGPTHDDITKKAFQEYFKCGLRRDNEVLDFVKSFFDKRGIPFSKSNYMQADVLDSCEILFNSWGTAPGMWVEKDKTCWIILPGVPNEMKQIFITRAIPKLQSLFIKPILIKNIYLSLAGIGESTLADAKLGDLERLLSDSVSVAYLPHHDGITLRITATGTDELTVQKDSVRIQEFIKQQAGEYIYSESGLSMSETVGKLLKQKKWTISLAESCTGGGISRALTQIPGSSEYVIGGIVAYDNSIKTKVLGVNEQTLQNFGAVSSETAIEMAKGIRKLMGTNVGLSVTGIAGPEGGTEQKPVGTIWFGVSTPDESFTFLVRLTKDRKLNQERAVMISLDALRRQLLGILSLPYNAKKIS